MRRNCRCWTNPTSCNTLRTGLLSVESWQHPGNFATKDISLPELGGCEKLDFSPSISVVPDGTDGSTPTGLNVEQNVPQDSVLNPVGLTESDVKNIDGDAARGRAGQPRGGGRSVRRARTAQIGLHRRRKPRR